MPDQMQPQSVTVETLRAFCDAWNRHDVDGLMSFMSDDCEFRSSAGPDVCGTRFSGREAVREGYAQALAAMPDAQWTRGRHFVFGDRGLSQWTLVGTRASDGAAVEVEGCDLFTFSGGLIRVKDSLRKQRG
jgi:ketosteroid isomerase-like protein